jgi:hypothetical protein
VASIAVAYHDDTAERSTVRQLLCGSLNQEPIRGRSSYVEPFVWTMEINAFPIKRTGGIDGRSAVVPGKGVTARLRDSHTLFTSATESALSLLTLYVTQE